MCTRKQKGRIFKKKVVKTVAKMSNGLDGGGK
jgi:hypothetical protein